MRADAGERTPALMRARSLRPRPAIALLAVALAVLAVACGGDGGSATQRSGPAGSETRELGTGPCRADQRSDPGADHVPEPSYEVDPPAGGEHLPVAAPPGAYREPPPDGNIVHSMEHGYVVLWFRPDAGDEVQESVVALGDRFRRELLVVPRPTLEVPIALTAWHRRLLCDEADLDQLSGFISAYRDQGPESGFL